MYPLYFIDYTIILLFGCNINTTIQYYEINNIGVLMKYYNQIIKELREDRDMSQKDIAKVLKIKQQTYSRYELGIRSLPIEHLISLCKFYKVSSDYILGLK